MAQPVVTHRAIQRGVTESNRFNLFIMQDEEDTDQADHHSAHHLVNHMRSHPVNRVALSRVRFLEEAFTVLLQYFASNTTAPLTTVSVSGCDFPRQDGASQLLSAFQTNVSVTHLNIFCSFYEYDVHYNDPPLDSDILAGLLTKNNSHMKTLYLTSFAFRLGSVDVLRRAFGNISQLSHLHLLGCGIQDEHLGFMTDGLVGNQADGTTGNTTLRVLAVSGNPITPNAALLNATRLFESTQLKVFRCGNVGNLTEENIPPFVHALSTNTTLTTLDMRDNTVSSSAAGMIFQGLVGNTTLASLALGRIEQGNLQLVMESIPLMRGVKQLTLAGVNAWNLLLDHQLLLPSLHQNTSFETFPGLELRDYPRFAAVIPKINVILTRNCSMKRVALLLQPLPRTRVMIPENNLAWRRAILRLACDPDGSGTSAIFQLLQNHPAILEIISPPAPQRGR